MHDQHCAIQFHLKKNSQNNKNFNALIFGSVNNCKKMNVHWNVSFQSVFEFELALN